MRCLPSPVETPQAAGRLNMSLRHAMDARSKQGGQPQRMAGVMRERRERRRARQIIMGEACGSPSQIVEVMTADGCEGSLAVDEHHTAEQAADSASGEKEDEKPKCLQKSDYPH